jgi:hypothetical protein
MEHRETTSVAAPSEAVWELEAEGFKRTAESQRPG